jgi:hypothetical protein
LTLRAPVAFSRLFDLPQQHEVRSILACFSWGQRSLESLQIEVFPFASLAALQYLNWCITEGLRAFP